MDKRSRYMIGGGLALLAVLYLGNHYFGPDIRRYLKITRM